MDLNKGAKATTERQTEGGTVREKPFHCKAGTFVNADCLEHHQ